MTVSVSPKYVETTVNYFPENGGTTSYIAGSAAFWNRKFAPTAVHVEDIRGKEAQFSLEKQGFQLVRHESEQKDFHDQGRVKGLYYGETEELIRRVTGATKVKGFSHEVRSADINAVLEGIEQAQQKEGNKPSGKVAPAMYAHIDNGPEWAQSLFQSVLGREEAERLRHCRWAIINVWRPIKPITRNPLGVCDTASVQDDDLVPVYATLTPNWGNPSKDVGGVGSEVQVYNVKSNPRHRWYFASAMQPDEVLFITIFDTNKTAAGHRRRVVHSAFPHASDEQSESPRESIEFRSLVVWEDHPSDEVLA